MVYGYRKNINSLNENSLKRYNLCNLTIVLKDSPSYCKNTIANNILLNDDDLCTCLDYYKGPVNFSCAVDDFHGFSSVPLNFVLNSCRKRSIKIKINSIKNLQEECCDNDCIIKLNNSHYDVIFPSIRCDQFCEDELENNSINMCERNECSECPECSILK